MAWTDKYWVFAVETFFKAGESVIATQKAFHDHFMLHWNDAVLDRKSKLLWVENLRTTSLLTKTKPLWRPQSTQTPENIQTETTYCTILHTFKPVNKLLLCLIEQKNERYLTERVTLVTHLSFKY